MMINAKQRLSDLLQLFVGSTRTNKVISTISLSLLTLTATATTTMSTTTKTKSSTSSTSTTTATAPAAATTTTDTTTRWSFDAKKFLKHDLWHGHAVLQLGGFWSNQGSTQNININGLIGDRFTVTNHHSSNGLVGIGYYLDGKNRGRFQMAYGINAFYLAPTSVKGNVIQEQLFTNLSYGYNLTHYPVYAAAKATLNNSANKFALTIDAGIGPNFMTAGGFKEQPLDNVTLPDNIFSTHTSTTFSAMAGIGIKFNNVLGNAPLECGYRFFYLGQGHFNKVTSQVVNSLNTGQDYANAVLCSITV